MYSGEWLTERAAKTDSIIVATPLGTILVYRPKYSSGFRPFAYSIDFKIIIMLASLPIAFTLSSLFNLVAFITFTYILA